MRVFHRPLRLILAGLVLISAGDAVAQQLLSPGKPFSNYRPAPTVSPYMNLFRGDSGDFDYQTLVQPMLRQQELNRRQQRTNLQQFQTNTRQRRTNQTQRRDIRRAGQRTSMPIEQAQLRTTGLSPNRRGSRFMNLYNFYPTPRVPRR